MRPQGPAFSATDGPSESRAATTHWSASHATRPSWMSRPAQPIASDQPLPRWIASLPSWLLDTAVLISTQTDDKGRFGAVVVAADGTKTSMWVRARRSSTANTNRLPSAQRGRPASGACSTARGCPPGDATTTASPPATRWIHATAPSVRTATSAPMSADGYDSDNSPPVNQVASVSPDGHAITVSLGSLLSGFCSTTS
jgi:hypothetical protein